MKFFTTGWQRNPGGNWYGKKAAGEPRKRGPKPNLTDDEALVAIRKFVNNYNQQWLIYRLGYKSPLEYREEYERKVA